MTGIHLALMQHLIQKANMYKYCTIIQQKMVAELEAEKAHETN
jgi:hypothetical protein